MLHSFTHLTTRDTRTYGSETSVRRVLLGALSGTRAAMAAMSMAKSEWATYRYAGDDVPAAPMPWEEERGSTPPERAQWPPAWQPAVGRASLYLIVLQSGRDR